MKTEYFLLTDEGRKGPFDEEDILDLLGEGKISAETICENEKTGRRVSVGELFEVIVGEEAPQPPASPQRPQRDEVLYAEHESWLAYGWSWLAAASLVGAGYYFARLNGLYFVMGLAGGFLLVFLCAARRNASKYLVTTSYVESTQGIFMKSSQETAMRHLRSVRVESRFLMSFFGVGDVIFSTTERDEPDVIFRNAPRAMRVKKLTQEARNAAAP